MNELWNFDYKNNKFVVIVDIEKCFIHSYYQSNKFL